MVQQAPKAQAPADLARSVTRELPALISLQEALV